MKRIKTLAMYLPQYHRLTENDNWWGEGFTEWTTVKAAEKLYEGHNQKREPLNDYYYDLMKKETMVWQVHLAEKYGIDGFCFYHYYFDDGYKILEKPAENLLSWKEIPMMFCFCWANQTWARTWSNVEGANGWSEKFENQKQDGSGILIQQSYGDRNAWKRHFEYLYPFFEDDRYIKVNNKPIFLIYKPEDIAILDKMMDQWQEMIRKKGFDGIYVIGVNSMEKRKGIDAVLLQGPAAYRAPHIAGMNAQEEWRNGIRTYQYEKIWENALEIENDSGVATYFGGFVDYDDTPRRGRLGTCMSGVTPQTFERNLYSLAVKNLVAGNKFLFINAWNEWGEGNYLEPDKKNGFQYLEAVSRVMQKVNQDDFDAVQEWDRVCMERKNLQNSGEDEKQALIKELNKFRSFYKLLDRWLLLKEKGKSLDYFFRDYNYQKILIYGFSTLGKHLYEELSASSSVTVVGAMDRRRGLVYGDVEIYNPEDDLPECDVIVVTAIAEYGEIVDMLKSTTKKPIISLQEVVFYTV